MRVALQVHRSRRPPRLLYFKRRVASTQPHPSWASQVAVPPGWDGRAASLRALRVASELLGVPAFFSKYSAARPATCGAAMLVPAIVVVATAPKPVLEPTGSPLDRAPRMASPGALTSGRSRLLRLGPNELNPMGSPWPGP